MSSISETSVWLKFFTEAGIPPGDATNYAITFTDHRIKQNMLMDLTKDILKDMSITVIGDVIAILKHAKVCANQISRQRLIPGSGQFSRQDDTNLIQTVSTKKSTPASRMLEHYVKKDQPVPTTPIISNNGSSNFSSRLSPGIKRNLDDDVSSSKRNSVFNRLRLGDDVVTSTTGDSPKITITLRGKDSSNSYEDLDTSDKPLRRPKTLDYNNSFSDRKSTKDEGLEYHGILKYSSREAYERAAALNKKQKDVNVSSKLKADTSSGVKSRLGMKLHTPVTSSAGIFAREFDVFSVQKQNMPSKVYHAQEHVNVGSKQPSLKSTSATSEKKAPARTVRPAVVWPIVPSQTRSLKPKRVVKKITRINKKTGEVISEEKQELNTNVFSRLGD